MAASGSNTCNDPATAGMQQVQKVSFPEINGLNGASSPSQQVDPVVATETEESVSVQQVACPCPVEVANVNQRVVDHHPVRAIRELASRRTTVSETCDKTSANSAATKNQCKKKKKKKKKKVTRGPGRRAGKKTVRKKVVRKKVVRKAVRSVKSAPSRRKPDNQSGAPAASSCVADMDDSNNTHLEGKIKSTEHITSDNATCSEAATFDADECGAAASEPTLSKSKSSALTAVCKSLQRARAKKRGKDEAPLSYAEKLKQRLQRCKDMRGRRYNIKALRETRHKAVMKGCATVFVVACLSFYNLHMVYI